MMDEGPSRELCAMLPEAVEVILRRAYAYYVKTVRDIGFPPGYFLVSDEEYDHLVRALLPGNHLDCWLLGMEVIRPRHELWYDLASLSMRHISRIGAPRIPIEGERPGIWCSRLCDTCLPPSAGPSCEMTCPCGEIIWHLR